jgi:hypothetical protein
LTEGFLIVGNELHISESEPPSSSPETVVVRAVNGATGRVVYLRLSRKWYEEILFFSGGHNEEPEA